MIVMTAVVIGYHSQDNADIVIGKRQITLFGLYGEPEKFRIYMTEVFKMAVYKDMVGRVGNDFTDCFDNYDIYPNVASVFRDESSAYEGEEDESGMIRPNKLTTRTDGLEAYFYPNTPEFEIIESDSESMDVLIKFNYGSYSNNYHYDYVLPGRYYAKYTDNSPNMIVKLTCDEYERFYPMMYYCEVDGDCKYGDYCLAPHCVECTDTVHCEDKYGQGWACQEGGTCVEL